MMFNRRFSWRDNNPLFLSELSMGLMHTKHGLEYLISQLEKDSDMTGITERINYSVVNLNYALQELNELDIVSRNKMDEDK